MTCFLRIQAHTAREALNPWTPGANQKLQLNPLITNSLLCALHFITKLKWWHIEELAYNILVVLSTYCGQTAKMWIVLFDAAIQTDVESFLGLSLLLTGFGYQVVWKSMSSAALQRTEKWMRGMLWCLAFAEKHLQSLSSLIEILHADVGLEFQRESA